MPKRVIDFDAMWGSDKLASCASWAQAEYAWLYGLADACGCFEITNLRVIWGRVAAIRGNLTLERLQQVFDEFQDKGLLFVWECDGKRYAHWTGSDVPGRLPAPSWRMRLERFAPPVPKAQLEAYMTRFARGRAARVGGGFRAEAPGETRGGAESGQLAFPEAAECGAPDAGTGRDRTEFEQRTARSAGEPTFRADRAADCSANGNGRIDGRVDGSVAREVDGRVDGGRKGRLEETQAQDLNWGLNRNLNGNLKKDLNLERNGLRSGAARAVQNPEAAEVYFSGLECQANSNCTTSSISNSSSNSNSEAKAPVDETTGATRDFNGEASGSRVEANREAPFDPRGREDVRSPELHEAKRAWERSRALARGAPPRFGWSEKELAVAREIWVGQGPVCVVPPKRAGEEKRVASRARGSGGGK